MDGTLIDTNRANFLSYKKAISTVMDRDCSSMEYDPNVRFNRKRLKNLFPTISDEDYKRVILLKEKFYREFLPETIIIRENTEILFKYSDTNRLVLVSNCRKERCLETLSFHGLTGKFSDVFYREPNKDEQRINKYSRAIEQLEISPNDIIAFENEQAEIADAMEAGIKIINPKILA